MKLAEAILAYSASNRSGGTIGSTQKLMAKRSCRNGGGDDDDAPMPTARRRTALAARIELIVVLGFSLTDGGDGEPFNNC